MQVAQARWAHGRGAALREEGQKVIQRRVPQLRQRISERRQRVERLFADQASSAEAQWDTLSHALDELLKSMPLDAAGKEGNHE